MIFEEQFPVPRYTAASKIGNSVISLLWQLRCRCNPDHNKFSSLSNTNVVAIFPKLCLWQRSLCSNLGGIDPEKLFRATLTVSILFLGDHTIVSFSVALKVILFLSDRHKIFTSDWLWTEVCQNAVFSKIDINHYDNKKQQKKSIKSEFRTI